MKGWAEIGHKDFSFESKSFMFGAAGKGKTVERSKEGITRANPSYEGLYGLCRL